MTGPCGVVGHRGVEAEVFKSHIMGDDTGDADIEHQALFLVLFCFSLWGLKAQGHGRCQKADVSACPSSVPAALGEDVSL